MILLAHTMYQVAIIELELGPGMIETKVTSSEGVGNGNPHDSVSYGEAQTSRQGSESDIHSTTALVMVSGYVSGSKKRHKRKHYRPHASVLVVLTFHAHVELRSICVTV